MTFRGALRAYNSAVRQAERESARRSRESARRHKAQMKQDALDDAYNEVDNYDELMESLLGLHKEEFAAIEWEKIFNTSPPTEPKNKMIRTKAAEVLKESFKPGFFIKLFGMVESEKLKISKKITQAMEDDGADFKVELQKYRSAHEEWAENNNFSRRILDGDLKAYEECILDVKPFDELRKIGCEIKIEFVNKNTLLVNLKLPGDAVIPKESKELLKSGKLSVKNVPASKFFSMYQDHVCGALLGAAKELFALLPVHTVFLNAIDTMLDQSTGHMKDSVIVSIQAPRENIKKINFEAIDPSEAMRNFKCNMDFKATTGFKAVDEIRYGRSDVA